MRVLAISGSLRRDSHNTRLLRAAAQTLPPGARAELFEGLAEVEPFSEDSEALPGAGVRALRAAVEAADAVLVATPEYNSSLPGQLKNAIDWLSRPAGGGALRGKPVAVIGSSTGMFGAVWAQADARKVLGAAGARVIDRELAVGRAQEAFDESGALADGGLAAELAGITAELVASAHERLALAA